MARQWVRERTDAAGTVTQRRRWAAGELEPGEWNEPAPLSPRARARYPFLAYYLQGQRRGI